MSPNSPSKNPPYFVEMLGKVPLQIMQIPGGSFTMGSPETESLRTAQEEDPQHEVSVPTFLMGQYPVTQAQWRFVAGLEPVNRELERDPSHFKGDQHPVESISWYETVEFCARLTRHTTREYRLPSEAEWEYACRAGTETPFYFGETITTDWANYSGADENYGAYGRGPRGTCRRATTPIDFFERANVWGLYDMHGNVSEWCLDHWHKTYEGAPEDGSPWLTNHEDTYRVLRGGSWRDYPWGCRSAYRSMASPSDRLSFIGFRVVCGAPSAQT